MRLYDVTTMTPIRDLTPQECAQMEHWLQDLEEDERQLTVRGLRELDGWPYGHPGPVYLYGPLRRHHPHAT